MPETLDISGWPEDEYAISDLIYLERPDGGRVDALIITAIADDRQSITVEPA